jgi:predicted CXXCH cytochrome family protein
MSCHDGTVAVDSYGGVAGSNTMASVTAWQTVGANYRTADISQEHPISVPPTDALVRNTPTNTATKYFGTITPSVECASCHDVHDQSGQSNLLVMDNGASAMCLSCHDK